MSLVEKGFKNLDYTTGIIGKYRKVRRILFDEARGPPECLDMTMRFLAAIKSLVYYVNSPLFNKKRFFV